VTKYIALLYAVNVGGTGKLSMSDLETVCLQEGFSRVETYGNSGNVVFDSEYAQDKVKSELEARLLNLTGKPTGVAVRTATEMLAVLKGNPFQNKPPNRTVAIFLDERPASDALDLALGRVDEDIHLGQREIYVYYPGGIGRSKLKIPAAKRGTARNMNTIAKLVEMTLRP